MGISSNICVLLSFFMIISQFCFCDEDAFGGVSIKVFRGPSKVKGRQVFAPFGYYVKMPVDSSHFKKESIDEEDESGEFNANDDDDNDENSRDNDEENSRDNDENSDDIDF